MNLSDYNTDIQKCSKCGLCMSVCPIFKVNKNECSLSRGLFIMLEGVLKGELKLNKKINHYLDMCLKCNACKDFCPTDVDTSEILLMAKKEYFKTHKPVWWGFLTNEFSLNFITKSVKLALKIYRAMKFYKFVEAFQEMLAKSAFGKRILFANSIAKTNFNKKISLKNSTHRLKIVYFKGCVNEYLNPTVKNATKFLLSKLNIEILPIDFKCCGTPFLLEGDEEKFIELAKSNISQIPEDFDYFITDCTTCKSTFYDYEKYFGGEILSKIQKINSKSISAIDFIVENFEKFEFKKDVTFTYHKPCHQNNIDFIEKFLEKCDNAKYVEMQDYNTCCGFCGTFALKNEKLSKNISSQKAQNSLDTNADYILTSCPACIMGLNQGLLENNSNKVAMNFIEFIAENIL